MSAASLPSGIFLHTILCGLTLPFVCSFAFSSYDCVTSIIASHAWTGESADFNRLCSTLQTGFLRLAAVVTLTKHFCLTKR